MFAIWWGPWLLTRHPHSGLTADQVLKAQSDVRATLVQILGGLAVAGGLIFTYRGYRLNQSQHVTETYAKAVEQLGHAKAPVRLGALHSLRHLAQDDPTRRQTVVDVLCAYLRMPYTPPTPDELAVASKSSPAVGPAPTHPQPKRQAGALHKLQVRVEELQVRKSAQRLLSDHLRRRQRTSGAPTRSIEAAPSETFWPDISLDLTGATLVDFNLCDASVVKAIFDHVTFTGDARFIGTHFKGGAWFTNAHFKGEARFGQATFSGDVGFREVTFTGNAKFTDATFSGDAAFNHAIFSSDARFDQASFSRDASFDGSTFHGSAWFVWATFSGNAWFGGAILTGNAWFTQASFTGDGVFGEADFEGDARFAGVTFTNAAAFDLATFSRDAAFDDCTFSGAAGFGGATFSGDTRFSQATFSGPARFAGATFTSANRFDGTTFASDAEFDQTTFRHGVGFRDVRVLNLEDLDLNDSRHGRRIWPDDWAVRPDPKDRTSGTLVRVPEAKDVVGQDRATDTRRVSGEGG